MVMVLSWIATCDGHTSEEEMEALRSIAAAGQSESDLAPLIELGRRGEISDLQLACEILREVAPEGRRLTLQLAIGVALEDGYLTTPESHIVRFLADLLGQSPSEVDELFREMTGHPFPSTADPSDVAWWEERESYWRRQTHRRPGAPGTTGADRVCSGPAPDFQRLRDLSILGLDETATADDVRAAYRRMAKVHHPDRFSSLGPEAVEAANVSFRRIQQAYERLLGT